MRGFSQSTPGVEPNIYHFVMDIAWFGLALATTTRFLSVYAIHLGATASQLTWMTALPALALLIAATFSGWWRSRFQQTPGAVFLPSLGFRLSWFLLALTPLLPSQWQSIWLIASLTLTAVPQGIAGVVFLNLMRESVTTDRWTALNNRRSMAMNAAIALGALTAGIWLERVAFPLNYQLMFLAAFTATLISLWHVMRVRPVSVPTTSDTPFLSREVREARPLRRMVMLIILTHLPFFMSYPLVPLHLVDGLGATEQFIALFGIVELLGAVFISRYAARWIMRRGNQAVIAAAMIGTGIAVGGIALAPMLWLVLPTAALLGASWALVGIGIMGVIADNKRPEHNTAYNIIFMQCVGLASFIGPLLGNMLITNGLSLVTVLVIGAVARIGAGWVISSLQHKWRFDRNMSPLRK